MVSPETFAIFDIFHHEVCKFLHMSRCPGTKHSKNEPQGGNETKLSVSATGLWSAAIAAGSMHRIAEVHMCPFKNLQLGTLEPTLGTTRHHFRQQ